MEDLSLSRDVDSEIDLYSETIEIRRSILCIICLGTYFNPVRLPCSHTFCGHCILEASRVKLRCPICSAEFSKRSINRVPNISEVIAEIDALVKSLTSDNRFSIPIEKLDEQYRERQKAVHSESQHTRSIPSSSLQPAVFDERENISKLCGTINVDVDIPSSSYFELVTSGISDTASSSSNDGACADPCQSVSGQRDRALLPVFSSSTSSQNQSLHTDLLVSEIVSDSHSSDGPLVLACTDYTCKEPEREIVPTRRKESQMEAAETSGVITTSFPSSSGMDPSDPLLSTETPVTAQLVHRNCSGIDITDAAFRPGEVVEVSSRMWPGMNKPGGAAWVLSVHHHPADPAASIEAAVYYDVKYVLNGNSDVSVHCSFVRPVQELSRGSRKRGLEPGPTPALILAPVLCMQPKGRRKIAGSKALIMSSNESPGQKSAESEEINGDSATSGSGSRSRCKGSHVRGPHAADISEHKAVSKRDRIQRGSSALREERDGTDSVSVSVSVLGTSSLPSRSVCISHTSLENADILKLEKFIQKFSSQLHDNSCPSSSTSSSSASSSSTPRPVTLLSPRVPSRQTPQSSCTLTDNFDGSITHLIVSVDKKGLLRKRTLKFMQAIMAGLWILTPQWLSDSVLAGGILPEGGYEVSGYQKAVTADAPRRARLAVRAVLTCSAELDSREEAAMRQEMYATLQSRAASSDLSHPPPIIDTPNLLFSNKVFLLYGSFPNSGPPRSKIAELLQTGDAVVVTSIDDLCRHRCRHRYRHRWRGKEETLSDLSQGGSTSLSLSAVCEGGKSNGGTGKRGKSGGEVEVNNVSASVISRDRQGESSSGDEKMVVCTDLESVLTFVGEWTKLLDASLGGEYDQIISHAEESTSSRGLTHRGRPKRMFLRMSEKYPVEGCNLLLPALASVNSKSRSAYDIYCSTAHKENVENDNDGSLMAEEDHSNMDEITILNPIWLFDSIANYSLATIA